MLGSGKLCECELFVCMLHIYEADEGQIQGAAGRAGRRTGNWKGESVSDGCDSLESQIQVWTSYFTILRTMCLIRSEPLSPQFLI